MKIIIITFAELSSSPSVLRLIVILLPIPVYNTEYIAEPFDTVLIGGGFDNSTVGAGTIALIFGSIEAAGGTVEALAEKVKVRKLPKKV